MAACEGGLTYLMLQALGDVRYLSAAERCGDVVWKRGLLRKGYGLCHGAAGNGYTFLQLHRLTGQAHHWQRALQVCHQLPNISVATPPSISVYRMVCISFTTLYAHTRPTPIPL